ncbi:MAG: DNA double-strand break repair nuclease NurA [Ktedonobacteraceae bacterium]
MPYHEGTRLPGERASRLGHLEVLKSDLVKQLCARFEDNDIEMPSMSSMWKALPEGGEVLPLVFGVDGSLQVITSDMPPHMAVAFVKTALLAMDQYALSQLDQDAPHPFALRDILSQSAEYHSTVFPLRHASIPGMNNYDAIRQIVFESLQDPTLEGAPLETLKWLLYEKWSGAGKTLAPFGCPQCDNAVSLPYDAEVATCPDAACQAKVYVTDFLGFHQEMAPDSAPDSIVTSYMMVHETLLLFSAIHYFWEHQRQILATCLFVKDGPLALYSQYSKLTEPIRRFLAFAQQQHCPIYLFGQEKTGRFVDHLALIRQGAPSPSLFIPDTTYISEHIQHRMMRGKPYGEDTNYGAKVFVKLNEYHSLVLSIPTGTYVSNPTPADLIGLDNILATLPTILSNRYEGALLPIELAHNVASLSTYPSAPILKMFVEKARKSGPGDK